MAADYFEKSRCRVSLADGLCEQDGPDFGVHLPRWYRPSFFVCLPWSDCRCLRFISDYKLMNYRTPRRFNYRPSARQKIHRVSYFYFCFFRSLQRYVKCCLIISSDPFLYAVEVYILWLMCVSVGIDLLWGYRTRVPYIFMYLYNNTLGMLFDLPRMYVTTCIFQVPGRIVAPLIVYLRDQIFLKHAGLPRFLFIIW